MKINKNKGYTLIILLLTIITLSWIVFYTPTPNVSAQLSITEDDSTIDDTTLDCFIRLYALDILELDSFEMTRQNREKIRSLLASMGDINIQVLKQTLFQDNHNEMVEGVKSFINDNFLWEEKALMVEYIVE